MRRKNFLCKMTAAVLSAAMVVTCTSVTGQIRVNAEVVEQEQTEFSFGSAGAKYAVGEHELSAALKKDTDITSDSMASGCLGKTVLTVKEDGSATVTVDLLAVSAMGTSSWASDWKIYQEQNTSGDPVAATVTKTDADGNATQIQFALPDTSKDGVYVSMYVGAISMTQKAYIAFNYPEDETAVEKKTGSAKVDQFGGYDVNVVVSVQGGKIVDIEVEGANFGGSMASTNEGKLEAAADALKEEYIGKSATDVSAIEGIDAVSGATYSSNAIQSAVLEALGLTGDEEVINLPSEKLSEGTYQVDIAFYADGVKHSLVENDTTKATINVDTEGNMTLTTAVISGTEKEPLYVYAFNGYYEGNDVDGNLKSVDTVKKEDTDFSDDVFGADEQIITEVTFPLEGDFAAIYYTNASIYVPAMNKLTGEVGGITFDQGKFSTDCLAKIYWDSLSKVASGYSHLETGAYTLPVSMKKATDITADSMAGACLQGAVLSVKEDGTADVTLNLTGTTVGEITAWASDWKIYQGQGTDSETVNAEVTGQDADGNVTQITFTLPANDVNGVYVNMSTNGHANNAYLAFDFANATRLGYSHLETGAYTLPVSMKKATDITADSMAGACLQGAVLSVKEDGTADVTLNLTGTTVGEITAWASNWKIYQGQSVDSETVDAEVTGQDADGNVTQITFALPSKYVNGVYVNMSTNGHANNAYLAFDYANAVKNEVSLENGVYLIEGTMYKPGLKDKSMADSAFNHNVKMTVENGRAILTLDLKGMEITGFFGYLETLKYYDTGYQKDANGNPTGTLKDVTVESVQKYSDGVVISDDFGTNYPDVISFEVIPEALEDGIVPLQVFVPIMESITAGTGNQNVYLKLDLDSLVETTAEDERFKDTEQAPANPDAGTDQPTNTPVPSPDAGTNTGTNSGANNNSGSNGGTASGSTSQTSTPDSSSKKTVKVGQTAKVNGHTYKVTAKGKVAFTKCKKNVKSITIPATVKINGVSCKVTSVAKNACKGNKKLTKVTLGKNVSKVGKNAFSGCTKLKTVKLPKGLTKKKKTAFKKQLKKAKVSSKATIK